MPKAGLDSETSTSDTIEVKENVEVTVHGAQTSVGDYTAYVTIDSEDEDFKESNYLITNEEQPFKIMESNITVSHENALSGELSGECTYDGQKHTVDLTYFGLSLELPEGYTWSIKITYLDESGKVVDAPLDAGTYTVRPSDFRVYNTAGKDVTDNYTLKYEDGTYIVNPRELTVNRESLVRSDDHIVADDKEYDTTTDATVHSELISLDNVVEGETVTIEGVTGTFEDKHAGEGKDSKSRHDKCEACR